MTVDDLRRMLIALENALAPTFAVLLASDATSGTKAPSSRTFSANPHHWPF